MVQVKAAGTCPECRDDCQPGEECTNLTCPMAGRHTAADVALEAAERAGCKVPGPDHPTAGQVAFQAFVQVGHERKQVVFPSTWEEVSQAGREGWEAAANAARNWRD